MPISSSRYPRCVAVSVAALSLALMLPASARAPAPSMAEVLKQSHASDWRALDPANTLYVELSAGRVVIELAPMWAPHHVANIKTLVQQKYFDGIPILRAQDNYVVQWGDPDQKRPMGSVAARLAPEFARPITPDLPFTRLPDRDTYAPQVGYSAGFPTARDPAEGRTWLAHCYGMVGAGRDNASDSGNGAELYVVIGHAPRHLDRNVTLVGRVVQGISLLSALPRGTAELGFYEKPEQRLPITAIRLAADVPAAERSRLEVLRTDTATFRAVVEALRFRGGDWYKYAAGHVELCNVPIAVRTIAP